MSKSNRDRETVYYHAQLAEIMWGRVPTRVQPDGLLLRDVMSYLSDSALHRLYRALSAVDGKKSYDPHLEVIKHSKSYCHTVVCMSCQHTTGMYNERISTMSSKLENIIVDANIIKPSESGGMIILRALYPAPPGSAKPS